MSRIMIDIDGCVGNYVDAFRDCVAESRGWSHELGIEEMGPAESWTFYKQRGWDMTTPEFLEAMRHSIKYLNLFGRLKPYEGALDGLWQLHDAGHQLVVVSSRTYGPDTVGWAMHQTTEWLRTHDTPKMKVILTSGADKKSEVCKEHELTIAIEDSPDNYEDLAYAGVWCYLMTRPWNEHVDATRVVGLGYRSEGYCMPIKQSYRVNDWSEFVKKVNG